MIQQQIRTPRPAPTTLAIGAAALLAMAQAADAAVIAGWTFENPITFPLTGAGFTYGFADQGDAALRDRTWLTGTHASDSTAWTTPAGNGSAYSLSSDRWSQGDFYEIRFATDGYENITISWDQTRSATGPSNFGIDIRLGYSSLISTGYTYNVIQANALGSGTDNWSTTGPRQSAFTHTVTLATLLGGSGVPSAEFIDVRFKATGLNLGNGTNRIDNIFVTGTAIAVPAPGALGLAGIAGLAAGGRRRRA